MRTLSLSDNVLSQAVAVVEGEIYE